MRGIRPAGALALVGLGAMAAITALGSPGLASRATGNPAGSSTRTVVPGRRPALAWPRVGEAAVAVSGVGLVGATAGERPVPIASLTKMMTAIVILHDHPLVGGEQGPIITISRADVADYVADIDNDDSTLQVAVGERLSEYRLLQALLLPSGDNIADLLGTWDAGSVVGFVARMESMARVLGLHSTSYADASGVSPRSESTAADQAVVAARLMSDPVARRIVRQPSAKFPVAGKVPNYNPAIGVDGIVGIKSGWTSEAQSCLATAAYRRVSGQSALVITVVIGEHGGLRTAALVDERLLSRATRSLVGVDVLAGGSAIEVATPVGRVTLSAPTAGVKVVGWPGLLLSDQLTLDQSLEEVTASQPPIGSVVGRLVVVAPWGDVATVPLRLAAITPNTTTTTTPTTVVPTTTSTSTTTP